MRTYFGRDGCPASGGCVRKASERRLLPVPPLKWAQCMDRMDQLQQGCSQDVLNEGKVGVLVRSACKC